MSGQAGVCGICDGPSYALHSNSCGKCPGQVCPECQQFGSVGFYCVNYGNCSRPMLGTPDDYLAAVANPPAPARYARCARCGIELCPGVDDDYSRTALAGKVCKRCR